MVAVCLSAERRLGVSLTHQRVQQRNIVTNAFRRGVRLGAALSVAIAALEKGHQCLSAGSTVGRASQRSTSHGTPRHECLSAGSTVGRAVSMARSAIRQKRSPMPFGGEYGWESGRVSTTASVHRLVTNAFRRGVRLGDAILAGKTALGELSPMPFGGEYGWEKSTNAERIPSMSKSHQCLSAGSTVGSQDGQSYSIVGSFGSPMPFGGEYGWEGRQVVDISNLPLVTNAFRRGVRLGESRP